MKNAKRMLVLVNMVLISMLCACGGGSGGSDGGSDSPSTPTVNPKADMLELSSNLGSGTLLSHGGGVTLEAYVTYTETIEGAVKDDGSYEPEKQVRTPVPDGTRVNFSIEDGGGAVTSSKLTQDGIAVAEYQGRTYGGMVEIKASVAEGVSDNIYFEVAPAEVGSITVGSITPEEKIINVRGTGKTNVANIDFMVTDSFGNPVDDGRTVFFEIANPLGGEESLSSKEGNTLNGNVSVALVAGEVAGPVSVRAIYPASDGSSVATEAQVTIVSGKPVADHFSMATEYLNLAGGVQTGLQNTISAYLGDRYGNVIAEGTQVSFISECGTIGTSAGFDATTEFGIAQAILQTSAPTVPELDGGDPNANPGLCRVVAYTRGSEAFDDVNGNGRYDEGIDVLTVDMSDPYIDENDNGRYDVGEFYIDANQDGEYTAADGKYQADTTIWADINILISDYAKALDLTPKTFDLQIGECQSFTATVSDLWGNALVAGTTISVESSAGEIKGLSEYVMPDTSGPGFTFSFDVCSSNDPETEQEEANITVSLTPAGGNAEGGEASGGSIEAPGNNGAAIEEYASGNVNIPLPEPVVPPAPAPKVVFSLPNDEATEVPVDDPILLVFSQAIDTETLSANNVYVVEVGSDGSETYYPMDVQSGDDTTEITLDHRDSKTFNTESEYLVTLTNDILSAEGEALNRLTRFSFTTSATPAEDPVEGDPAP